MSTKNTRRNFLRISSAGLAAGAVADAVPAWATFGSATLSAAEISVRITDEKRRFESASTLAWRQASRQRSAEIITLNPEKKFQQILGFGAAFTDASCYMFHQLSAASRQQLFHA